MAAHPPGEQRDEGASWSRAELWIGSAALFALIISTAGVYVVLVPVPAPIDLTTPAFELVTYALEAAAIAALFYWHRSLSLRSLFRRRPDGYALVTTLIMFAAVYIITSGYYRVIYALGYMPPGAPFPDSAPPPFANALTGVVAAPLVEEVLFRSVLFRGFKSHYGLLSGLIISSAIFAGYHLSTSDTIPLFVFGVGAALLYNETGSLWSAILFHMSWNALVLLGVNL